MSDNVKMIHWAQMFIAYRFCQDNVACETALQSCSTKLITDFERIRAGTFDLHEGLSEGSGVESANGLQQLEAMIAEIDANTMSVELSSDASIAPDSMEAQAPSHALPPETTENNAATASQVLGSRVSAAGEVRFVILKFSRSPEQFRRALLEGPELED